MNRRFKFSRNLDWIFEEIENVLCDFGDGNSFKKSRDSHVSGIWGEE